MVTLSVQRIYARLQLGQQEILLQISGIQHMLYYIILYITPWMMCCVRSLFWQVWCSSIIIWCRLQSHWSVNVVPRTKFSCRKARHENSLFCVCVAGYSVLNNPWLCLVFEAMEGVTSALTFTAAVTYAAKLSNINTDYQCARPVRWTLLWRG